MRLFGSLYHIHPLIFDFTLTLLLQKHCTRSRATPCRNTAHAVEQQPAFAHHHFPQMAWFIEQQRSPADRSAIQKVVRFPSLLVQFELSRMTSEQDGHLQFLFFQLSIPASAIVQLVSYPMEGSVDAIKRIACVATTTTSTHSNYLYLLLGTIKCDQ